MGRLIPAGTGQKKFKDIIVAAPETDAAWCDRGGFRKSKYFRSRNEETETKKSRL